MYQLSQRSLDRLKEVHPNLVLVVQEAIKLSTVDFIVVEGIRTIEKQREYVAKKVSRTMNSKHLRQEDGFSHAVDLAPIVDGQIPWKEFSYFKEISKAMKQAASNLGVQIIWGGDWKTFVDGPHYELA
jgi:peptidoglycan L-alanyl-D-glutamate endopeptidase CwlK